MGKGDCTVITLPDGKHIMVDAGSNKCEKQEIAEAKAYLQNSIFKNKNATKNIHALILTHPDKDHINKVKDMCTDNNGNKIDVRNIYFADLTVTHTSYKDSPMASYKCNSLSQFLVKNYGVDRMTCVALNTNKDNRIYKWETVGNGRYAQIKYDAKKHRLNVPLKIAEGKNWSVSIIAGNNGDQNSSDSPVEKNASSLAVLVEFVTAGKRTYKFLACGDANSITEKYLMAQYAKSSLGPIDLMLAPHHGSSDKCSTKCFLDFLKPEAVIFSVHLQDNSHHHARKIVVDRYKDCVSKVTNANIHKINFWESFDFKWKQKKDQQKGMLLSLTVRHEDDTIFSLPSKKIKNWNNQDPKAALKDYVEEQSKKYLKSYQNKQNVTLLGACWPYVYFNETTNYAIGVTATASNKVLIFDFHY
jgi:beta-lactamase superfamily II metal-dependent hydrolase